MDQAILIGIWFFVFVFVVALTYKLRTLKEHKQFANIAKDVELLSTVQNVVYAILVVVSLIGVAILFFIFKDTLYGSHLKEWLNLTIRLMHITFGIAWIGASFYFVFLENALNRTEDVREELAGNLWAIHGGGFYYLEKYKQAPKSIPKELHWFKYEAYFTWLTGFALLIVVYYFNANSYLIDPKVLDINATQAISIGIGALILGWIIYDQLCKRLIKQPTLFLIFGLAFLIGFAWFFSEVFSGRAAYIHFGALLGTIMAANVFFVIIPGQKAMVAAAQNGIPPNPEHAKAAGMRSRHNNYFTFPVLFVMISNHFPSTFGHQQQWVVLVAISLGLAGIKHYLNLREQKQLSYFVMPFSIILLFAVAFYTAPQSNKKSCKEEILFNQVTDIVKNRCTTCHSANPTDLLWKVAPNGVAFDTPEQILNMKDGIFQRVVVSKDMPFNNNQTNMLQEERDLIECWILQGAKN
jgi:uncharacterized membrane protein